MRVPSSTYRLQLHAGFTLDDAASVAPRLAELGVSHLYLSPILAAAPGSTHGYDTVDPTRIDADRGGRPGFDRLRDRCRELGLGLVLDIVPNHQCVSSPANPWWRSVLRFGAASPWAGCFDIDWSSPDAGGRLILPVLGDALPPLLRAGELHLGREAAVDAVQLTYHDHHWPLRPATLASVLRDGTVAPLADLAEAFAALAAEVDGADASPVAVGDPAARRREAALADLERRLAERLAADAALAAAFDRRLAAMSQPDELSALIEQQHYRPMFWREGGRRVNYRRFFDIDGLAAVRAEDPAVFEATSSLILELAALPEVDGLRVDHPDGLRDPGAYFRRLAGRADDAWIVAEKILEPDERLPEDWPVAGTTGYDFMNDALRLLVAPEAEPPLTAAYREATGRGECFPPVARAAKRHAAEHLLRADLDRLTEHVMAARSEARGGGAGPDDVHGPIAGPGDGPAGRGAADSGDPVDSADSGDSGARETVADILTELAACLPVYRTYLAGDQPSLEERDAAALSAAAEAARRHRPDLAGPRLDAIVTLLRAPGSSAAAREAAIRFQQFSAPLAAKGVEDTAFYRFLRFPALNEVGGDPGRWSCPVADFHRRLKCRAARWPDAMLAGTTHDAKRSEDVRARLAVLSEMPERWIDLFDALVTDARRLGGEAVDPNHLWLLGQTLVGAWPIEAERAAASMVKAAREGKEHSAWRSVNQAYEAALTDLVHRLLEDADASRRIRSVVDAVRVPGRRNSLVLTALRLAAPGVPDLYQGNESWDLSLVDPDNRRPVDAARRARLMDRASTVNLADLWTSLEDPDDAGLAKAWLTRELLQQRRQRPEVFGGCRRYRPLDVTGPDAAHCLAFARGEPAAFVAVLPLRGFRPPHAARVALPPAPAPAGDGTAPGAWINRCDGRTFTGATASVGDLLERAPLALLVPSEDAP